MRPACSRDLERDDARPYFVWEEMITVAALRRALRNGPADERVRWAARVLRDARFDDVWRFLTPEEVARRFPELAPRLGRRRDFWAWILDRWRADGLVP